MPKRSRWYAFVRWLVKTFFFRAKGGLRTVGDHHVPLEGPLLVAPVHLSYLDPPAVACATARRQLTFMAKEELFRFGPMGALIRSLGAFPIRRGETDTESLRHAIALLEEGRALLVFPEGTRGDGETLGAVNRGVTMLAKRTGAKVLPVGVIGTHIVMPRGKKKGRRHPMTIAFGEPFTYADVATAPSEKENRERFAEVLTERLSALMAANGLPLKTAEPKPKLRTHPDPGTEPAT